MRIRPIKAVTSPIGSVVVLRYIENSFSISVTPSQAVQVEHQYFCIASRRQRDLRFALQLRGVAAGKPVAVDVDLAAHDMHIRAPRRVEREGRRLGPIE